MLFISTSLILNNFLSLFYLEKFLDLRDVHSNFNNILQITYKRIGVTEKIRERGRRYITEGKDEK